MTVIIPTHKGKPISEFSDDELWVTLNELAEMDNFRHTRMQSPKYIEKFKNQPISIESPVFSKLINDINSEMKNRKG